MVDEEIKTQVVAPVAGPVVAVVPGVEKERTGGVE